METLTLNESSADDLTGVLAPAPKAKHPNHGGSRKNSGQKSKVVRDSTEDSHVAYARARADHERLKAQLAEHELNVKSGKYVSREDVQRVSSVAFATVAQALRSIPDNLERRLGLSPNVTSQVSGVIDEAMDGLSLKLEEMYRQAASDPIPEEMYRQAVTPALIEGGKHE
jgi:hypothetical protein